LKEHYTQDTHKF